MNREKHPLPHTNIIHYIANHARYTLYLLDLKARKFFCFYLITQPAFICSKLTIETLEKGVKYVQS